MSATQRSTPEGQVAAALIKAVEARGGFIRKLKWENRVGAPDYLIAIKGHVYFVETKAPGKKVRPAQAAEFRKLHDARQFVFVLDRAELAETLIEILTGPGASAGSGDTYACIGDFLYEAHL